MPPGVSFVAVSAGNGHSVGLASNGAVWAWGGNRFGQLGNGTTNEATTPVAVVMPPGVTFTAVSAGGFHSVALATDGTVWAWGANVYGQIGDGTKTNRTAPVRVTGLPGSSITGVSAGAYHTMALAADGTGWAWGNNAFGQLGDGTATSQTTPVMVAGPPGLSFTSLSSGIYHSLAVASDGTGWGWGSNSYGEVGDGTNQRRYEPVKIAIPAGRTFSAISAGYYFSLALDQDGAAWAWGTNYTGQLGDGTTRVQRVPILVRVRAGTVFAKISAGYYFSLGVSSDGAGWAWGGNRFGELGDGTTLTRLKPVKVKLPVGRQVSDLDAGRTHVLSLLSSTGSFGREDSWAASLTSHPVHPISSLDGADWPKFRYDLAGTGYNPAETTLGVSNVSQLTTRWMADLDGPVQSSPAVVDGVVYVGSTNGKLYALDASTGVQLWATLIGKGIFDSSPTVVDGVVYVGAFDPQWSNPTGGLFALDAATGTVLWGATSLGPIQGSPLVWEGVVYIGASDGSLHAFDAAAGVELWAAPMGDVIWYSSAVVVDGVLFMGTGNVSVSGTMHALDATTGFPLWVTTVGDRFNITPAVADGIVYAGSEDGNFYAMDSATGVILWSVEGDNSYFTPGVANGVVYVTASDSGWFLKAFDSKTGVQLWSSEIGSVGEPPAIANGVVYVGSMEDWSLYAVEASSGVVLWRSPPTGFLMTGAAAVANGWVYVGSQDGFLYAYSLPS